MTTIYFVRHAQSDWAIKEQRIRPLTEKGLKDRELVTEFLKDKNIDLVFSSPYKRAFDTIHSFAQKHGYEINTIEDFIEAKVGNVWIEDYLSYAKKQWEDFSYKLSDGESLKEVQERNVSALNNILINTKDKNIVIGTHGTALSTIINYYDKAYEFEQFQYMVDKMPWIVKMKFDSDNLVGIWKYDLFKPNKDSLIHTVLTPTLGTYKGYEVVAMFARYHGKWLYPRAKTREVFEMIGGGIENGESTLEAANRELYEETGATEYSITPVCDYRGISDTRLLNGQLFFVEIEKLDNLPEQFEMAEVKLFDSIPKKMRFPEILPILYEKVQGWLNLQSAKDEIWDIYDENRKLTGRTHRRADPLTLGDYHLVVHVWLQNSKGEFLITKRAPNKGFPNMWECTGGSAITGDDSLTAAIREVKEETGLDVNAENGEIILAYEAVDNFSDVWLFKQDFNINDVVLQEGETVDVMYATKEMIFRMFDDGEFVKVRYLDEFFSATCK